MKWLQNSSQANGDNVNSVRRETCRTFQKKEGTYERRKFMHPEQQEQKHQRLM
jgi:hypothetical protein